jgi:hypothetical protein
MNSLIDRNLPTWKINDPTKITEHYSCNRKYFYSYVLGWRPEGANNHLIFGSSYHIAQEYLLSHDYSVQSVMKAHEAFVADYRSHLGPETDEMFEIAGKVNLTDDQVIYFRMDSILRHKTKETIKSIEHKTGSSTYNWELQWPLSMQNGTYSHVRYCRGSYISRLHL